MKFNLLFIWVLGIGILILVAITIKTILQTRILKSMAKQQCTVLEMRLEIETQKRNKNNQNIILINDLHQALLSRFFKITQEILLMQKLIFETYIK